MQAIARVNRVFRDKPAGLIVDYMGIAQNLKSALSQYSGADRSQVGVPEADAVAVLLEKYEIVRDVFQPQAPHGFDYRPHGNAITTVQVLEELIQLAKDIKAARRRNRTLSGGRSLL